MIFHLAALLLVDEPASLAPAFLADDYPMAAIDNDQQGTVVVDLLVTRDGRVGGCSLLTSSGSAALDYHTCEILRDRAKFEPAKDGDGNPVESHYRQRILWKLPEPEPEPQEPARPDKK